MAKLQKIFNKLKLQKYLPKFPISLSFISLLFYLTGTIIFISGMSLFGIPIVKILYGNFADSNWEKIEAKVNKVYVSKKYKKNDIDLFDPDLKNKNYSKNTIMYSEQIEYSYSVDSVFYTNKTIYPNIGNWRSSNSKSANEAIIKLNSEIISGKINVFVNNENPSKSYILKLPTLFILISLLILIIFILISIWLLSLITKQFQDFIKIINEKTKLKLDFKNKEEVKKRLRTNIVGFIFLSILLFILNSDAGGVTKEMYSYTFNAILPYKTTKANIADINVKKEENKNKDTIYKVTLIYDYKIENKIYKNSNIFDDIQGTRNILKEKLDTIPFKTTSELKSFKNTIFNSNQEKIKVHYNRFEPSKSFLLRQKRENSIENSILNLFRIISYLFPLMLLIIIIILPFVLVFQQIFRILRDTIVLMKLRN
ncbi:hypothetical protein [Polaribacter marinivivus]|uniref:DUF3592 domain-containing protein n=1 Tax=Polaribacter marinivivus TaxID=1524260 RepID=A0ABV8RCE3_9FLAO